MPDSLRVMWHLISPNGGRKSSLQWTALARKDEIKANYTRLKWRGIGDRPAHNDVSEPCNDLAAAERDAGKPRKHYQVDMSKGKYYFSWEFNVIVVMEPGKDPMKFSF